MYEVQTHTVCDGWTNCWSVENEDGSTTALLFRTQQEAEDAIMEFFADLGAAGMHQLYSLGDYRVVRTDAV